MPRVDVWDVPAEPPENQEPLRVGLTRGKLEDRYDVGKQLGQGGFGSVQVVVERSSGKEYACKSITKRLSAPNISAAKQEQHLENIRREALILWRLRGTLNVVHLEDVFEDDEAVHLVMEWCKGGELLKRINTRHYSERTAASYMRAVLRTLAQCHHLRILHRDVKPGNFMLLTDSEKAPVKAIDFGLAVFFDPKKLPRRDLGLEGTPHFMAPEQLSGKTEPASDIWSAGVMAYQLLCGFVPFDDPKNPRAPALSLVWRAILTEEPKFTHRSWEGVSEQAKDFVRSLLVKDPAQRPTAKQALAHPWLQGKSDQRTQGAPLARTVVQRLQKFGVESALKRTVLDMIANDLINRHMEQLNHLQAEPHEPPTTSPPPPEVLQQQQQQQRPQQQPPNQQLSGGQKQQAQPLPEPRFKRKSSAGHHASEVGEATPEGAAAAAVAGSPHPPPPAAAAAADGTSAASGAVSSRLRQLAAQDLLLRSASSLTTKHPTVHAGGDALAALRRGQLMGVPGPRPIAAAAPPPPPLLPLAPGIGGANLAAALAAMQQQQQLQLRRRSHDYGKRPLGRAATSITPDEQDKRQLQAAAASSSQAPLDHLADDQQQPQQEQQEQHQKQGQDQDQTREEGDKAGKGAVWRGSAGVPSGTPPPQPAALRPGPPRVPLSGLLMPLSPSRKPQSHGAAPGSPGGSSSGRGAASPSSGPAAAASSASATAAASGAGYRGPVKDLAAATAWDMSFMKNRLAMEGSGHALQHYAWLLNVGERSLHGVLERSYHAGRHHSPGVEGEPAAAGGAAAGSPAAALPLPRRGHAPPGAPSVPAALQPGHQPHQQQQQMMMAPLGPSPGSRSGGGGAPLEAPPGGSPDYLRMLSLVARQRAEHRKAQRLSLDTSGHRQTHYEKVMAAEAAGAGADPRVGSMDDMAPPQEADEEEDEAGGTATASTVTATSLPPPSGNASALVTATSLTPPTLPLTPTASAPPPPPMTAPEGPRRDSAGGAAAMPSTDRISRHSSKRQSLTGATPPRSQPPSPPRAALPSPSPSPPGPLLRMKPSIPGLAEADALSRGSVPVPAAAGAAAGAVRRMASVSKMSHASSALPDGDGGGGDGSLADWEEDEQQQPGAAGSAAAGLVSGAGSVGGGGGEGGKRSSLLKKVRKALMQPMKNLLTNKASSGAKEGGGAGRVSGTGTGTGTGTVTPIPGGRGTPLAKLSPSPGATATTAAAAGTAGGGGGGGISPMESWTVDDSAAPAEERGRGRGAYAAFLQYGGGGGGGTGASTPQERSAHGGTERSVHGGRERSAHNGGNYNGNEAAGNGNDRSNHSDRSAHNGKEGRSGSATHLQGPAGYAIHTVKAHKPPPPPQAAAAAAAGAGAPATPVAVKGPEQDGEVQVDSGAAVQAPAEQQQQQEQEQQRRVEAAAGHGPAGGAGPEEGKGQSEARGGEEQAGQQAGEQCGVSQEDLAPALGLLLGDPAKVAELQDVMRRLQYDKAEELTYEQLSEGLQWLGYRLEPSEVQDLLRQATVGANEGLTASQFIASQVDWRTFQANHRAEWLDCLRKAFEELGGGPGPGGHISLEQLMAALHEKLPEDEVNLAVQESLMDAAVEADEVDFDAFVKMMRCNSNDSLGSCCSSEMSYDLYDPRLKDASLHGPLGDGVHYHPALETVPDDQE